MYEYYMDCQSNKNNNKFHNERVSLCVCVCAKCIANRVSKRIRKHAVHAISMLDIRPSPTLPHPLFPLLLLLLQHVFARPASQAQQMPILVLA